MWHHKRGFFIENNRNLSPKHFFKYHVVLPDQKRITDHGIRNIQTLIGDESPSYCRFTLLGKEAWKLLISLKWKRKEIKKEPPRQSNKGTSAVFCSLFSCFLFWDSEIHSLNPSNDQKIGGGGEGRWKNEGEETRRQHITCWLHLLARIWARLDSYPTKTIVF